MERRGLGQPGIERRGFIAALGAGAVAELAVTPSWARAATAAVGFEDVSQHAVLAVNAGGEAWMLDSLIRDVKPHQLATHYRPAVSLSGPRLYLHVAPKT